MKTPQLKMMQAGVLLVLVCPVGYAVQAKKHAAPTPADAKGLVHASASRQEPGAGSSRAAHSSVAPRAASPKKHVVAGATQEPVVAAQTAPGTPAAEVSRGVAAKATSADFLEAAHKTSPAKVAVPAADATAPVKTEVKAKADLPAKKVEPKSAPIEEPARIKVKSAQVQEADVHAPLKKNARPLDEVDAGPAKMTALSNKIPRPKLASVADEAMRPLVLPTLYDRRGRLIMPAALKGTHEILVHQNTMADSDGLDRIQDDDELDAMRTKKLLVDIPETQALLVNDGLPENRRAARPWTVKFLEDMSRAHYAQFHRAMQVNSAVRTVDFQLRLMQVNGNAAPVDGDTASPHLTGQAVDIAKHGLSVTEIAWMRGFLKPLIEQGKVDVEEEFQQACFHVSVYRKYAPPVTPKVASKRSVAGKATLVAAVRMPHVHDK